MKNRRIENKVIFIIINILLLFLVNIIEDYYQLSSIYFYYILITTSILIFYRKKISLLDVWNIAFLFIILSEAFIEKFTGNDKIDAIKYLVNSNIIVNIFYIIFYKKYNFKNISIPKIFIPRHSKISFNILLLLVIIYFVIKIKKALLTFSVGRNIMLLNNDEGNFFISIFINPIGMVLPSVIAYYLIIIKKKSLLLAFICSLPIYTILFLEGTRFPLLFSLLGFGIVGFRNKLVSKLKFKDYLLLIMGFLILVFSNTLMKHFRNSNLKNTEVSIINSSKETGITEYLTSYMSPEGVIDMTDLSFQHFKNNDHMYGKSSSFILYFWVPRSIWPEKPTMLGHWLIRKYRSGFGEAHSSSFGFTGDLYADFGKLSYFFVLFFGVGLAKLETFKNKALLSGDYTIIIGAISYAFIFFFVRSPITSMMNFIGILFYYFLLKKLIFKQVNATKNIQLQRR